MKCYYFILFFLLSFLNNIKSQKTPISVSGIYPSLANFNNEGECGTGALVPWADRLWVITYGPHLPFGSSDKLYEITSSLDKITRPESIGGTPANRMIHKESNQLFIGPYVIDAKRNIRVIPIKEAPGRFTGIARDIFDPTNKIVIGTMEEGFYRIDVNSLNVNTLYMDGNAMKLAGLQKSFESDLLVGVHGKGLYSGQGVMVFSNNGEQGQQALVNPRTPAGSLSEWDGKNWKLIRRNQFTEVTGPGGIYGNKDEKNDPIWTTGWDFKSLILGTRNGGKWFFFRLPKASNTYDGAHGWNTEWPRIRDIGDKKKSDLLMTMHGMFWHFPKSFNSINTAGIRPRSSYLKVIGDFARWNNQLVFGCDDAARSEFLSKRKAKGGIMAPGQSQSNLWFTTLNQPDNTGNTDASGSIWQNEIIKAGEVSEPFLFAGWKNRSGWISNESNLPISFTFEKDFKGNNKWKKYRVINVPANASLQIQFAEKEKGEWIRAYINKEAKVTVSFVYHNVKQNLKGSDSIFNGIAKTSSPKLMGGLLYCLGNNRQSLGIVANTIDSRSIEQGGYYELDPDMHLYSKRDDSTAKFIRSKVAIPSQVVKVESGSYLIIDDNNRRWRLPLGDSVYETYMNQQNIRICREVATERDLFNCGGTFYELPSENADGFAKIRPIASHNFIINDYVSYRGMLVMTGIDTSRNHDSKHIFVSDDKKCAVWAGVIDDLWKLGKPVGRGGPWVKSDVHAFTPSDPYLFTAYDNKILSISHESKTPIDITVQFDPIGDNTWMNYKTFKVLPNKKFVHKFSNLIQARWIRFISNKDARLTTWLEYNTKP